MTENPRYRGLRPNPESLGVTLLEEGEETRTMRVRAAADVIAWAASLSAADRGVILSRAYAQRLTPARPQQRPGRAAPPAQGQTPAPAPEGPPQPAQRQRATLARMPADPRPQHALILAALEDGGTLTREPGQPWRLIGPRGLFRTLKPATVELLTREGVLTVSDE